MRPKERGEFLPDRSGHAWHWVLLAVSVAFSRTAHWNFPCGSPRTRAVPLLLAAAICKQLLISIPSLWGPRTLRLRQSWVKPVLRRLRLAFLVPRVHIPLTYPSPDGGRGRAVTFPNTAVCSTTLGHFGSLLTFAFSGRYHMAIPKF